MQGTKDDGRLAAFLLVPILLYAGAASVVRSAGRAFWYDEICTIAVVSQATLMGMWNALLKGVDTQPPLFYVVEALALISGLDPHVAYRIPSVAAMLAVSIAVYVTCRHVTGQAASVVAALVPLFSALYTTYAIEARPYGLVVAAVALAVAVWRSNELRGRAAFLFLALTGATSLHYYAVFVLPAFVLAESVRSYVLRELRPTTWLALSGAVFPLAMFSPLLTELRRIYGASFWAKPSLGSVPSMYDSVLGLPGLGFGLCVGLGAVLLATNLPRTRPPERKTGAGAEDIAMVLGLLALPFVTLVAAKLTGGGLTARYVLPMVVGMALACGYTVAQAPRAVTTAVLAVLMVAFATRELRYWAGQPRLVSSVTSTRPEVDFIQQYLEREPQYRGLPVILSDGLRFLPAAYYSAISGDKTRIGALVDPPMARIMAGSDSVDVALSVLSAYLPIDVQSFETFRSQHRQFLLHSAGGTSPWDWWPRRLLTDSYRINVVALDGSQVLYHVAGPPRDDRSPH